MRRRLLGFAGKLLGLAVATTTFVSFTWLHFVGPERLGWLWWWAIPIALTGAFVPAMMLGFRFSHPVLRLITLPSAIAIGFLSFETVAAMVCWIAVPVSHVLGLGIAPRAVAIAIFGTGTAVAAFGLLNAVVPRTTNVTVALPHLPPAWEGKTIALVSDIHLGNIRAAMFTLHLVWRLQRARPEMVLIGGDMFDGTELDLDRAVAGWAALRPRRGVYVVTGNHDERGKRGAHLHALRRVGLRVLDNERVVVDGLQLIGVHDNELHRPALYRSLLERAGITADAPSILLAHQPVNLAIAEAAGVSLQLSGHTHGGQFFPFSLVARRVHGRYVYGLQRFRRMQIYTSSGAGTWGPPFRVGTRSEIVLLTLTGGPPPAPPAPVTRS